MTAKPAPLPGCFNVSKNNVPGPFSTVNRDGIYPFRDGVVVRTQEKICDVLRDLPLGEVLRRANKIAESLRDVPGEDLAKLIASLEK